LLFLCLTKVCFDWPNSKFAWVENCQWLTVISSSVHKIVVGKNFGKLVILKFCPGKLWQMLSICIMAGIKLWQIILR